MIDGQARLAAAEQRVKECEQAVLDQERRIAEQLRQRVRDANAAALLRLLRHALQLSQENRDVVQLTLAVEVACETQPH